MAGFTATRNTGSRYHRSNSQNYLCPLCINPIPMRKDTLLYRHFEEKHARVTHECLGCGTSLCGRYECNRHEEFHTSDFKIRGPAQIKKRDRTMARLESQRNDSIFRIIQRTKNDLVQIGLDGRPIRGGIVYRFPYTEQVSMNVDITQNSPLNNTLNVQQQALFQQHWVKNSYGEQPLPSHWWPIDGDSNQQTALSSNSRAPFSQHVLSGHRAPQIVRQSDFDEWTTSPNALIHPGEYIHQNVIFNSTTHGTKALGLQPPLLNPYINEEEHCLSQLLESNIPAQTPSHMTRSQNCSLMGNEHDGIALYLAPEQQYRS